MIPISAILPQVTSGIMTSQCFDDLTQANVYAWHANKLVECANEILAIQGRKFEIPSEGINENDSNLRKVLQYLLFYFNGCELANSVFPDKPYRMSNNILLCGGVGVGKTLIMDAFARYLRVTKNPMVFQCASVTQMSGYYKLNNHIDKYTYNEESGTGGRAKPVALCMNDLGIATHKHFGTDMQSVMDDFMHARYEIYTQFGLHTHITTNLTPKELVARFHDEYGRLDDRFKTYNVIWLKGKSMR